MALTVDFTSNTKDLIKEIQRSRKKLKKELTASMRRLGGEWERRMKTNQFGPFRGKSFSFKLQNRSGSLRRSIRFRMSQSGGNVQLRLISEGVKYARIHEFGGTIKARAGKKLKIPLPDALTPSGNLRSDAVFQKKTLRNKRTGKFRRSFVNSRGEESFVFKSKAGNLLIARRMNSGRLRLLFTLKDKVKIKARLGFRRTWFKTMKNSRQREFRRAIERSFR